MSNTVCARYHCTTAHARLFPRDTAFLSLPFHCLQGVRPWGLSFVTFFIIHLAVFLPASLLSARNINYMMVRRI